MTWGIRDQGEKRLFIQWQEVGGPTVVTPQRKGFGTVVVERMSLQVQDASASLKYPSSGVIWYLEAPYDFFVQAPSGPSDGIATPAVSGIPSEVADLGVASDSAGFSPA